MKKQDMNHEMKSTCSEVEVRLYGSLQQKGLEKQAEIQINSPVSLPTFIKDLGLPITSIKMAMVNHKAVASDTMIHPGDSIALFPAEYPFFADWKSFWSKADLT